MTADVATMGIKVDRGTKRAFVEPDRHCVHLYESDAELIDALAVYLAIGLARGEAVICLAEPQHVEALTSYLATMGIDLKEEADRGTFLVADAATTLESVITRDEMIGRALPKKHLFEELVDDLYQRLAGSERKPVRVFGGMSALLYAEGNPTGAICLEELWNDALARHPMRLYCGYRAELVSGKTWAEHQQICGAHGFVLEPSGVLGPTSEELDGPLRSTEIREWGNPTSQLESLADIAPRRPHTTHIGG